MGFTNLLESGHFPYNIVEFTKFRMRQVCNPQKKSNSHVNVDKYVCIRMRETSSAAKSGEKRLFSQAIAGFQCHAIQNRSK